LVLGDATRRGKPTKRGEAGEAHDSLPRERRRRQGKDPSCCPGRPVRPPPPAGFFRANDFRRNNPMQSRNPPISPGIENAFGVDPGRRPPPAPLAGVSWDGKCRGFSSGLKAWRRRGPLPTLPRKREREFGRRIDHRPAGRSHRRGSAKWSWRYVPRPSKPTCRGTRDFPCTLPPLVAVSARLGRGTRRPCCRSSVVEHSLGKGEVDSSILSGSTRPITLKYFL
jgi:hypothetical protein